MFEGERGKPRERERKRERERGDDLQPYISIHLNDLTNFLYKAPLV